MYTHDHLSVHANFKVSYEDDRFDSGGSETETHICLIQLPQIRL